MEGVKAVEIASDIDVYLILVCVIVINNTSKKEIFVLEIIFWKGLELKKPRSSLKAAT